MLTAALDREQTHLSRNRNRRSRVALPGRWVISSCIRSLGDWSEPRRAEREVGNSQAAKPASLRDSRALRVLAAALLLSVSCAALISVLRGPFGLPRLLVKALIPAVVLLAARVGFAASGPSGPAARAGAVVTMVALVGLCLGVYGVPMIPPVLLPMLGLTSPAPAPLAAGVLLLAAVIALAGRWPWLPEPTRRPLDVLYAVVESIYAGGFLLAASAPIGSPAWVSVALAVAVAARLRGIPLSRALLGASALVSMALWSGSSGAVLMVHIALLAPLRGRTAHAATASNAMGEYTRPRARPSGGPIRQEDRS